MARLGVHGHAVLCMVKVTSNPPQGTLNTDLQLSERRTQYRLMSDGTLLRQFSVVWKDGTRHSYGWKLALSRSTYTPLTLEAELTQKGFVHDYSD